MKFREYHDKQVKREDNSKKVFALILGQCSQALLHRMEAHTTYEAVDSSNDPIQLLKLIQGCIYQRNTTRKAVHSYIDAKIALHNFRQDQEMETAVFLERFKELVHVYEELGGEPGASTARIQTKLNDIAANANNPTNAELKQAKEKARDKYLGVLFLLKSDRSRLEQLVLDIENDFTCNIKNDGYPTDLISAYNTLISFRTSTGRPSNRRR